MMEEGGRRKERTTSRVFGGVDDPPLRLPARLTAHSLSHTLLLHVLMDSVYSATHLLPLHSYVWLINSKISTSIHGLWRDIDFEQPLQRNTDLVWIMRM